MSTEPPDDHYTKEELLTAARQIVENREAAETPTVPVQRPRKKEPPKKFDWSSQGALVFGGVLGVMIVIIAIIGWTRSASPPKPPLTEASMLPSVVEYGGEKMEGKAFVGIETMLTMRDELLVTEIKRIAEEKGLPSDIFVDDIPSEMNVAHELNKLFRIYKDNPGELSALRSGISSGEWAIREESLKQVADILTRVEPRRLSIRSMLEQKDACFTFEFTQTEVGLIPETDGADFMEDYVLLEEYAIARALLEGKIKEAVDSLAYIFRLAQLAAEVQSPEVRSKAAKIRRYALDIMQTVVFHPKFQKENLIHLYEILNEQLENWTDDGEAWIGDRANGLKVYNLVAQYGPEGALLNHEVEELRTRGILDDWPGIGESSQPGERTSLLFQRKSSGPSSRSNLGRNLEEELAKDQVYYLRTMRAVIEECRKPFYQRRALLNLTYDSLRRLRNTSEEPIIAGFLLHGIPDLMEYIAFDRTECETAFLAMSVSLRRPVPSDQIELDPLFGKKYETRQMLNSTEPRIPIVQATYSNSLKPFRVPDYSN